MNIFAKPVVMIGSLVVFVLVGIALYGLVVPEKSIVPILLPQNSASLKIDAPSSTPIQQPFYVDVRLNTMNNKVNAIGINMRFDPKKIQVMDMDTRDSFCQFYPERNFDNSLGQIVLACGSPHPGFTGENSVVTLQLIPVSIGETTLYFSKDTQVLASDGKGTNILDTIEQAEIKITNTL